MKDTIFSSKTSPAALNRFIYYPDHLVRLPTPSEEFTVTKLLTSIVSEPLLRGLPWPILSEFFVDKRSDGLHDESVGSFMSRRLSPAVANNFVSAMMHGIYAGDIWKLSMKSILPYQWECEGRLHSITNASLYCWNRDVNLMKRQEVKLLTAMLNLRLDRHVSDIMRSSAVFTFRDGIGQLVDRLVEHLQQNPNVTIKTGTKVASIQQDAEKQIELGLLNQDNAYHSHMISTISAPTLCTLARRASSGASLEKSSFDPTSSYLPSLHNMYATTVQVVSLYYPDPKLIPYTGFGYLIPQTVPFAQNPEHALGVIFDSSYGGSPPSASPDPHASQSPNTQAPSLAQDTVPGTKLTVMLGGHWWDGYTYYPSEQEGLDLAKSVLQRHLGITASPMAYNAVLQKNCIPQYTVGHYARMRTAHEDLKRAFKGRLRVAGSWYTGVGVNDCIKGAWTVVQGLKDGLGTGLEAFDEQADPWVYVSRKQLMEGKEVGGP